VSPSLASSEVAALGEFKLVARSRWLLESGRIPWRPRDYFRTQLGVA